jgi:hypothetical protein
MTPLKGVRPSPGLLSALIAGGLNCRFKKLIYCTLTVQLSRNVFA